MCQFVQKDDEFWRRQSYRFCLQVVSAVVIPESCCLHLQAKLFYNAVELVWNFDAEVLFWQRLAFSVFIAKNWNWLEANELFNDFCFSILFSAPLNTANATFSGLLSNAFNTVPIANFILLFLFDALTFDISTPPQQTKSPLHWGLAGWIGKDKEKAISRKFQEGA